MKKVRSQNPPFSAYTVPLPTPSLFLYDSTHTINLQPLKMKYWWMVYSGSMKGHGNQVKWIMLDMVLVEFQTKTELETVICGRQVNTTFITSQRTGSFDPINSVMIRYHTYTHITLMSTSNDFCVLCYLK